jgi:hypothetical protein
MPLIWVLGNVARLRHNGTTGKLRMTCMRELPVVQLVGLINTASAPWIATERSTLFYAWNSRSTIGLQSFSIS